MSKPLTSYNSTTSSVTSTLLNSTTVTLNSVVQLLSGFTTATVNQLNMKNNTTFSNSTKNNTSYNTATSGVGAWYLNSTFLTLSNSVYLLSGFTVVPSNQLNYKTKTTYTAV